MRYRHRWGAPLTSGSPNQCLWDAWKYRCRWEQGRVVAARRQQHRTIQPWALGPQHWDSRVLGSLLLQGSFWGDQQHLSPPWGGMRLVGPCSPQYPWAEEVTIPVPCALHRPHLGPQCHPWSGSLRPSPAPAAPRLMLGPGAGTPRPSQPSPCQPDLFHGYVLPRSSEICLFNRGKKAAKRMGGRKGLPEPVKQQD